MIDPDDQMSESEFKEGLAWWFGWACFLGFVLCISIALLSP